MTSSGFFSQELDGWLDRLLDLPPARRRELLDAECDDPELRDRIERILAAEGAGPLDEELDRVAPELVERLLEEPGDPYAPGSTIGEYRLIRELGRGGMGAVYLAERTGRDFSQRVALKLVKRGMDSDAILARFVRERRILARLQHESIARLLDGGTSKDGRPFLVMEYVEGQPLTVHCDERRLPVEARLRLFVEVCRAVQYAHSMLVIHRDLKPSNVLVTEDGRLKLLDFGVARIMEGAPGEESITLTVQGRRPLTPEYAAPEQLSGEHTTTATDVYGLGVLLYHLLTGHLPYRFARRSVGAAARAVLSSEPARPSAAIRLAKTVEHGEGTTDTLSAERVAADRDTRPQSLARRLSGDLDAIVLKALRKEPEHRYASVEALADDVRRHLEGAAVAARKGTVRYRAMKFVRRHAFGLGVTAAAVIVASAFLTFHVRAVAHQRDLARQEAARAEQISDFVLDIFDRSDPLRQAAGDSLGIEELVEAGAARVQTELEGQPAVRADLQIVLGRLMIRLGRSREALELFENALETRSQLLGEESPEAINAMIFAADAHMYLGGYAEAAALQSRVLELRRGGGADPAALASALEELGRSEISLGNLDRADSLITEALGLRRAFPGETSIALGHVLEYMAVLRRHQGRFGEAADFARQAVAAYAGHYGEDHRRTRDLQRLLGLVLTSDTRYEEAEAVYRRVLTGDRAELGDDHPTTAASRHDLGSLLLEMQRLEEAETLLRQALETREATEGPTSTRVGVTLSKLATVLTQQDRMEEALELHRRALEIRRINFGDRSSSVGTGLNQLGLTLSNMGRAEEAIPIFREAADIYREQAGERHWWVGVAVGNEARAWHRLGDLARADSLYRLRHAINEEALGPEHFSTAGALHMRGRVGAEQGRWEEAAAAFSGALPVYEDRLPEGDPRRAELRSELGEALSMLGRFDEAERLLVAAAAASDNDGVRSRLEGHRRRAAEVGAGGPRAAADFSGVGGRAPRPLPIGGSPTGEPWLAALEGGRPVRRRPPARAATASLDDGSACPIAKSATSRPISRAAAMSKR